MDRASLPDLNSLDRDRLLALFRTQQEQQQKVDRMLAARDEELRRLEAELEAHRQTLSEQAEELHSRQRAYRAPEAHDREAAAHDVRHQEREDRPPA